MKKPVLFTDLDGTLLDYSTYSFEAALPALQLIKEKEIPLVICSSKTRKEIEYYRKKMGNTHPFVTENGGGIFIPKNYFKVKAQSSNFKIAEEKDSQIITLGAKYSALRKTMEELRREGFQVRGFGDMTVGEVAGLANMTFEEAAMAKERDFDEPFVFGGDASEVQSLIQAIQSKGFNVTQGRFYHILGDSDKGKAVSLLIDLYKKQFGEIATVALGDSPNDIPMFERVDYPVIVQKPDGNYDPRINMPNLIRSEGVGPGGWNKTVLKIVNAMSSLSNAS